MSCLVHLTGGPTVIIFLLARLSILPWWNCKTYSISCSWWILCVSKIWHLLENHVNAISKHVCGTPIFNKNTWSSMLNVSCSIILTPLYGKYHEIYLPLPKGFSTLYPVMDIMLCLSLGRIYPWIMCLNTFFLSIVLFNLIIIFSFLLFGLTFLVISRI